MFEAWGTRLQLRPPSDVALQSAERKYAPYVEQTNGHASAPMEGSQTGIQEFSGIDYINRKTARPEQIEPEKDVFNPPVRSSSPIKTVAGIERPFTQSQELGYND
jgi:hypothetical protein